MCGYEIGREDLPASEHLTLGAVDLERVHASEIGRDVFYSVNLDAGVEVMVE